MEAKVLNIHSYELKSDDFWLKFSKFSFKHESHPDLSVLVLLFWMV